MEVLSVSGAAPDQVVSIRAGGQRKQAAVSSLGQGIPFRLASGPTGMNPFRIDILKQVGSARLAVRPGEGNYSIEVKDAGEGGEPVRVGFAVRALGPKKGEQGEAPPLERPKVRSRGASNALPMKEEEEKRFLSQTAVAKEYLEAHELLPFVRALLQTVIRDRPLDPYSFIAEQFRIAAAAFKPAQPAPGFAAAADAFVDPELEKETGPDPPKLPKSDEPVGPSSELPTAVPGTTCRPQREEEEPQDGAAVEGLRLRIRDVLGQAAEDGTLAASLSQVEPPEAAPFAPKAAEPLVIRRAKAESPEVQAPAASPLQTTVSALDANASPPADGEAALAKMTTEAPGDVAKAEVVVGNLDALSVAESHEEDTKLAKEKPIRRLILDADKGATTKPQDEHKPPADAPAAAPPDTTLAPIPGEATATEEAVAPRVVPELESLRQKAQEALLNGAQTGELWNLLQRFAAKGSEQKASASAALCQAAQSGELVEALRKCGTAQAAVASAEFDRIRQHAVESLVVAAEPGRLLEALHERKVQEEETKRAGALLQEAREQVTQAADSGDLAAALAASQSQMVAAGQDLEQLREVAREALLMAAESGELAEVLAEATGTKPATDDVLRTAARDALLRGAQSGQLLAELRRGKTRSLPGSPLSRPPQGSTPASTVIDEMSEAASDVQRKATLHTSVAARLVQEMTDLAAELGQGSVLEQNTAIKAKIAELKRQYDKLIQERDELKSRMRP